MRSTRLPALLAAGLIVLTACGSGGGDAPENIQLVAGRMASGVDPVDDQSSSYLRSYGAAEGLTKIQADGSVAPELAESVSQTAPNRWTVTLRDGARFWSGAPADAGAVAASLERSRGNSTLAQGLLDGVTITTPDARTIVFTTEAPSPYLDYALAHYSMVIHNAGAYDGADPTDASVADLTGPFELTGFETERSVTLVRNDDWWGGAVAAPGVDVELVTDEQSRAEIGLAGQADIIDMFPSGRAEEADAAGLDVESAAGATTVAVYLNQNSTQAPALADQRVRQALGWGTDREKVVALATNGLAAPLPSWLASNPAYPQADESGFVSHEPERARELLDQAGWTAGPDGLRSKDGRPLRIRMLTFGTEAATGEVLQAQWRELGVDVQVRNVESSLATQAIKSGDWDTATQAWTTVGSAPSLIGNQIAPDGAANHGAYDVPVVPGLLQQASTAPTAAAREQAMLEVNDVMNTVVPAVPVHTRVAAVGLAADVEGFTPHPLQYENLVNSNVSTS
ncbi:MULTISPECIES: ABC transporter substrate-binding protein [Gordonia]|uniref:ABC transporter substrate-binding protein n=1 Tax=Gordonia TaxID=2053 RepID=UPI00339786BB